MVMIRPGFTPRFEDAYAALLLDVAAGAASPALGLLVETHTRLNPGAARDAGLLDTAAGIMLDALPGARLAAAPVLAAPLFFPRDSHGMGGIGRARRAISAALEHCDKLRWRWRIPGYREHDLGLRDLRLVRLAPGAGLPPHGHGADEWTLVLAGAFEDCAGVYQRGDLAFAGPSDRHRPHVVSAQDCVCLAATAAPLEFNSAFGRAAAWVLERAGA